MGDGSPSRERREAFLSQAAVREKKERKSQERGRMRNEIRN